MAKRSPPSSPLAPAKMTVEEMRRGIALLGRRMAEVEKFDPQATSAHDLGGLERAIDEALERTFGTSSSDYKRYCKAAHFDRGPLNMGNPWGRSGPEDRMRYVVEGRQRSIALLKEAIRVLEERLEDENASPTLPHPAFPAPEPTTNKNIFIVHGHDHAAREAVARVVEKLGLGAIILSEQTNQGRTLIEKFEALSDVGFAIILLTPDDVGGTSGETMRPRARQNVILELGYFVGKLSRRKVCALVGSRDLEVPSDTHGIVWIYLDEAWQFRLARELRDAGYSVDLNAL